MEHAHRGKFRNRVFLIIALVSVVPILLAGFLSVYSVAASHRIDVANLEDALLNQKLREIQNVLGGMVSGLQPNIIANTADAVNQTNDILLKKIFDSNRSIGLEEVSFVGLDGKELAAMSDKYPQGAPQNVLRDESGASWFQLVKDGDTYVSDEVDFSGGTPRITIAAPAKDQSGAVAFVLLGNFNLAPLKTAIQDVSLGTSGYLYLVDRHGKVLAGSFNAPAIAADMSGTGVVEEILGGKDFSGAGGQRRYNNFMGDTVVAAGKFVPGFGWGLVAEWPAKEADASVNDLIYRKNFPILFAVFIAVIISSILLAGFVVKPVRALEKGTALVAEGKFDTEVRINTGDELEELGLAFNKMTAGLKQLEELKNEFVFIAAHELRTPVAAMKGYLTLILQGLAGTVDDKAKEFIAKVVKSNDRLAQLVNDLLEVSRSEGGKLTIKVAPIDITEPIKGVLSELQSLADKASVTMNYEPATALPKVMADGDRVKEVMINLIGNSIKYMGPPKGEAGAAGTVTVSHETMNNELITHVTDTGLGMSKEAQAKLFQKFYRVSTDKTKDIQGTGLGLFIVKEIIEKMNGAISATSEGDGKGTTFSFTLPIEV
ncbi:MAG: sensor histidine kinase [Candidatus Liptonbacteria bacterium]|nr:sensor histidine kinase [Candidatus Liptonbacteria bacterium]